MNGEFVVSPHEWGWCIAVRETGEVMFFQDGDQAERSARAMASTARRLGGAGTVEMLDLAGRLVGWWIDDRYAVASPTETEALVAA